MCEVNQWSPPEVKMMVNCHGIHNFTQLTNMCRIFNEDLWEKVAFCESNDFQDYFDDAKESRAKQIRKIQESSFKNQDSRFKNQV